ncbi:MAG: hypothetical protein LLG01_08220 [Planctomycetaceae bacterium]|nr:hypothetical protein [Planctomycetaceae bacterium]
MSSFSKKSTDVRVVDVELYLLDVQTRVPLKFGPETLDRVTCARVKMTVEDRRGNRAVGWGETPLSVQWVWPSKLTYQERHDCLVSFCSHLRTAWAGLHAWGHPVEIGHAFGAGPLPEMRRAMNASRDGREAMPLLAALVCCSPFDIALHDAYGNCCKRSSYDTYSGEFMNADLSAYLEPAAGAAVSFAGKYPADFLVYPRPQRLAAWHLVGGKDPLDESELTGSEPDDGYPVLLGDWIARDGLKCLKVKLRGNDAAWDYARLVKVGQIAVAGGVDWLTSDFNCTVTDPAYVNEILDRLVIEHPRIYGMILYVEQPFPYDLEAHRIDVHSVSSRKPLFMDESAHEWRFVRMGRELGWSGVALKTCKTQTGALLSLCWAKAHGMGLMVQDLTNPTLAQIPHVLLAAHAGTIMGVETNAMQFYPQASTPEAAVHPGLYTRRDGCVDLSTLGATGFGYRVDEIHRELPCRTP